VSFSRLFSVKWVDSHVFCKANELSPGVNIGNSQSSYGMSPDGKYVYTDETYGCDDHYHKYDDFSIEGDDLVVHVHHTLSDRSPDGYW
jgi:sugar lactone lactonase YvrE